MFEAVELGRRVDKATFEREARELHTALLAAQRQAAAARVPLLVVVSGVEGAGKGEVVDRLNEWLDTRLVRTHACWSVSDEEAERPRFWRFWRRLPAAGTTAILFGSWYTAPIVDRVFGRIGRGRFERELRRIAEFERLLTEGGTTIVKFWFHLRRRDQARRLEQDVASGRTTSPLLRKFARRYDDFLATSERAIRITDGADSPWHIVEAADRRHRDLEVGRTLLRALQQRLERPTAAAVAASTPSPPPPAHPTVLDRIDLSATVVPERYPRQLARLQRDLGELAWRMHERGRNAVVLFEGPDAAGKGGAIRRVTQAIDARLYQVIQSAAPTEEERAQHYLWRFWRHIPRAGHLTIYDRSWYGRVLVERVEALTPEADWRRAYGEINDFEEQLEEHGAVLLKFWLHIDADEQLRRFREREALPWKQHKITAEDWRNRGRRADYDAAVDEMVARTSTTFAPWTLVAANDKRAARLTVLRTLTERLRAALA